MLLGALIPGLKLVLSGPCSHKSKQKDFVLSRPTTLSNIFVLSGLQVGIDPLEILQAPSSL